MKRIPFVDDEPEVLAGLRTRLHRLHVKWEMQFVESGTVAIERMQEIDSRYLLAVKAPFNWEDAVRRVAETTRSSEEAAA